MIRTHLKIGWRNLRKNRGYFIINVLGLSIALTISFLMLLWVNDERRMDKFHQNDDQLFLVKRTIPLQENVYDVYDNVSYPLLKTATEQFPEIVDYLAVGRSFEDNITVDNVDFRASGTFTRASLFSGFSFPVLLGDITALDKKTEALAISRNFAERIWGEKWTSEAMGSSVHIHDIGDFTVLAVYEDFPKHSSIQNDFYYSFERYLIDNEWMQEWGNNGMQGVFLLRPEADPERVSKKVNTLFQANIPGENKEGAFFQKFSENYLFSQFDERAQVSGGRIEYVRIFTIAAIFLLMISCINFINLSTAYASKRAAEIGVRKAVGAKRKVLFGQFITETALITTISFVSAYLFTLLLLPWTNEFTGKDLTANLFEWSIWISISGVYLLTTFLSGFYPALVISSFKPISALNGSNTEQKNTISLRKGLVILQFTLTTLLIIAAIIVRQQVKYINEKDLGIAKDHIVSIHQDQKLTDKYEVIRNELLNSEAVVDVTLAGPSPLDIAASSSGVVWPGKSVDQENIEFSLLWTAHNFPEVFEIPLSEGAYFREATVDTVQIVLNEKAIEIMNIEDPVGKSIQVWGNQRQIAGILKDFHNISLYENIQPTIFFLNAPNAGNMFVKLEANKTKEALSHLEAAFEKVLPDVPLHYDFIDEVYAANYRSEQITETLTYYFALVSILISCLGLFGLATFTIKQRTKEIGIRKVLGASLGNITALISRDFLKLVLSAVLIASPFAYFFMTQWLEGFAYKIEISWLVFLITGLFTIVIALLTIGFHTVKSAQANPVESLRTE